MGDWRAMGQAARRRMGRPSAHNAPMRSPSQLPREVEYPGEQRTAGRPFGTEDHRDVWDRAMRAEEKSKGTPQTFEDEWSEQVNERMKMRSSVQQKRMRPSDQYFG